MTARNALPLFALVLSLIAPCLRAETIGGTLDHGFGTGGARALSGVPAPVLESLHVASELVSLEGRGLLRGDLAADLLSERLLLLADLQPALDDLEAEPLRAALVLQGRVAMGGARELLRGLEEGPARARLLGAAQRLAEAVAELADRRAHGGADGPDNPCFQSYGACMDYCATLDSFTERSLCGMDCNLDFAACLGSVLAKGGRELLGGMIDVSAPSARD